MGHIILHKIEWDRLKKQASRLEEPKRENKQNRELMKNSQSLIKTCPDTEVMQPTKQKKKQQINKMAKEQINAEKKKQKCTTDAVKKARQHIFEDSCYGKRLISALMESKMLEERQAQVEFKNELQDKSLQAKAQSKPNAYCSFDLDEKETDMKHLKKMASVECARTNKNLHEIKKNANVMKEEKDKLLEQEDARLMEQLLIKEAFEEEKLKQLEKQAVKESEIEQEKVRKQRILFEHQEEVRNELYRKQHDLLNCKTKQMYKQIHEDRQEKSPFKKVYKLIETCQIESDKRYHFINERIKEQDQQNEKQIIIQDTGKFKQERITAEYNKTIHEENQNKCRCETKMKSFVCDRQCLIPKSHITKKQSCARVTKGDEAQQPSFLAPGNKLLENLRKREKEQSPWSGANAAHEEFARQAYDILQLCRYKTMAGKVIDDYKRLNYLDSSTLPIAHY